MTQATLTSTGTKLLWLGSWPPPEQVVRAVGDRWAMVGADPARPLKEQLAEAAVVLVGLEGPDDTRPPTALLDHLAHSATVAVFLVPQGARMARAMLSSRPGQFLCADRDAPAVELAAKLSAAVELQPAIATLRAEQAPTAEAPGPGHINLVELDEQMRLAGRLQQDFLPRRMPEVGPVRFAALYRPAGWVSGDLYDVARLDETHVGFYVADVSGHGMPAALLTMFIKKALQTKRIFGHAYRLVPPDASLAELNADLCDQELPSCQFCTAVYGIIDVASLTLTYAGAGHPEPILIRPDGSASLLRSPGGLLGVFPDATFPLRHVRLAAGDRIILYSDGLEGVLPAGADGRANVLGALADWRKLSRQDLLVRLAGQIGDGRTEDDVTLLVMDVEQGQNQGS